MDAVDRAMAVKTAWKTSGSQANKALSESTLGDILDLAISDFGAIYKCGRGHQIDPIYLKAFRHDILIEIEAWAKLETSGTA